MQRVIVFVLAIAAPLPALAQSSSPDGVLLLAHGGQPAWNARVTAVAAAIDQRQPTEVAFGMASRPAIQGAVDRLVARGVKAIIAVPLFVSSHSSVVTSTEYLLGARADMPTDLRIFAKMKHAAHGADHQDDSGSPDPADNAKPVVSRVPIRMTPALNRHPLVGEILIDRARTMSRAAASEAIVIVAHGPVPDADNARWLDDMAVLAAQLKSATEFAAVEYLTVRDDAPKPVRDAATEDLRGVVSRQVAAGRRVLVIPLLLSYGGIERGIRQRLEGLEYELAAQALIPDPRIVEWVRRSIASAPASSQP